MRAMRLHSPAGLDRLDLVDLATLPAPAPGEVQIRIRASSLNYHDYAVVSGGVKVADPINRGDSARRIYRLDRHPHRNAGFGSHCHADRQADSVDRIDGRITATTAGDDPSHRCHAHQAGHRQAFSVRGVGRRLSVPSRGPTLRQDRSRYLGNIDAQTAHYRVNQLGVYLGMRAVADRMIAAGGGSIVNTSSAAALRGLPAMFAYSATKWAVRGMSRSAAADLARHNVRVRPPGHARGGRTTHGVPGVRRGRVLYRSGIYDRRRNARVNRRAACGQAWPSRD